VSDPLFAESRLARLYDELVGRRDDLDLYVAVAEELCARSVIDLGCGTGSLACRLALRGLDVVGVDPAEASLEVARTKPGADRVRWVQATAEAFRGAAADLVVMTGNVAQVFLEDAAWLAALAGARRSLCEGGYLVFESRDPQRRAWEDWTRVQTMRDLVTAHEGVVRTWIDVLEVAWPRVSFRHVFHFLRDDTRLESISTLRFRDPAEIEASLEGAGFTVADVRGAPDRPGRELIFLTRAA
jgi:SAM-dependent methyltransferase